MINDVIQFWFKEHGPEQWFQKDDGFDQLIRDQFLEVHRSATQGELFIWRRTALGRLAEVIVLDQFSRNLHRDSALAFAYDGMALTLAQEAVSAGMDQQLEPKQRSFLYMPYMHSESLLIHEQAERLFKALRLKSSIEFERKHLDILERFGRYPHRNAILGRESTPAELEFLSQPGSSF
ncbi:MAG: DUF924 family protein [Pseudomonadota bacterium]